MTTTITKTKQETPEQIAVREADEVDGIHLRILSALAAGQEAWWDLAAAVYEFHELSGWVYRDCEKLEDYLGELAMGRTNLRTLSCMKVTGGAWWGRASTASG